MQQWWTLVGVERGVMTNGELNQNAFEFSLSSITETVEWAAEWW